MRWMTLAILAGLLTAGCASDDHPDSTADLPRAVQAAFAAEHPYAKIDQVNHDKDSNGNEEYVIAYSNPDGAKASAIFGPSGESRAN
jgi:hypothetical protein